MPAPTPPHGRDRSVSRESLGPGMPLRRTRYVTPAILIMLAEGPAHGYSLVERLRTFMPRAEDRPNFSVLYRFLNALEELGALRSTVTGQEDGPRRRQYALTEDGTRMLERWLALLQTDLDTVTRLLAAAGLEPPASRA